MRLLVIRRVNNDQDKHNYLNNSLTNLFTYLGFDISYPNNECYIISIAYVRRL